MIHSHDSTFLALLAATTLFAGCAEESAPAATRPNVIVIVIDTLRADHVLGRSGIATPGLDRLARDGVDFEMAFAHAPMTLPSHTALFSSRYPHVSGTTNNREQVDPELPLLAAWLHEAGYDTSGVISIGTLRKWGDRTVIERGFDTYVDEVRDLPQAHETQERLRPVVEALPTDRPFFLFAHYSDPHSPYNAHGTMNAELEVRVDGETLAVLDVADMKSWSHTVTADAGMHRLEFASDGRFRMNRLSIEQGGRDVPFEFETGGLRGSHESVVVTWKNDSGAPAEFTFDTWVHDLPGGDESRRRYRLEVEYADRAIGELLDELDRRGLYEDSLIVFTSDHGQALGEHDFFGHIRYLYDEAIHVPLIVKLPRGHPAKDRLEDLRTELVRHIDVVPTILELCALPPLPGQMGTSLLEDAKRVHFSETRKVEAPKDLVSLRDERFKMIYCVDDETFEMYDLAADPGEEVNVFTTRADERPGWKEQLVLLGARAEPGEQAAPTAEALEMLEALGYAGE